MIATETGKDHAPGSESRTKGQSFREWKNERKPGVQNFSPTWNWKIDCVTLALVMELWHSRARDHTHRTLSAVEIPPRPNQAFLFLISTMKVIVSI
jgi:hypothetical protein